MRKTANYKDAKAQSFVFCLFASLCLGGFPSSAASPASPLDQARSLYDAGRYAQAADAFGRLAAAAPRDAALRYDLGNALFKAGRLGPAVASYERAFALDPRDRDIRFNLDFALRRAGEDFVPPGMPPLLFRLFTALSEREAAGLHWISAWLTLWLAAALLLWPGRRERLRPWLAVFAVSWALLGLWWLGLRAAFPPDLAVVTAPRAEVRHGPGPNFGAAFTAPEGRLVRVLNAAGEWLEVGVLKEGARGWVEASAVEKL